MSHVQAIELGMTLSTFDRRWLDHAYGQFNDERSLRTFMLDLLKRSLDWKLSDNLGRTLSRLNDEEIEWLCTDFESVRRQARREGLRDQGRKL